MMFLKNDTKQTLKRSASDAELFLYVNEQVKKICESPEGKIDILLIEHPVQDIEFIKFLHNFSFEGKMEFLQERPADDTEFLEFLKEFDLFNDEFSLFSKDISFEDNMVFPKEPTLFDSEFSLFSKDISFEDNMVFPKEPTLFDSEFSLFSEDISLFDSEFPKFLKESDFYEYIEDTNTAHCLMMLKM
jgi:hypothetical protein